MFPTNSLGLKLKATHTYRTFPCLQAREQAKRLNQRLGKSLVLNEYEQVPGRRQEGGVQHGRGGLQQTAWRACGPMGD